MPNVGLSCFNPAATRGARCAARRTHVPKIGTFYRSHGIMEPLLSLQSRDSPFFRARQPAGTLREIREEAALRNQRSVIFASAARQFSASSGVRLVKADELSGPIVGVRKRAPSSCGAAKENGDYIARASAVVALPVS